MKSDSKLLGAGVILFAKIVHRLRRLEYLPATLREAVSISQPNNPLKKGNLPSIHVAIPCHKKDFKNLTWVVAGAKSCVENPINSIQLITPKNDVAEAKANFPDLEVLSDEEVIGARLEKIIKNFPIERQGWISQQVIKIKIAIRNESVATLILDADTILLQPRIWIDSSLTQVIDIALEWHPPYKAHQQKVFGFNPSLFSYVTHYQVMKRDVLIELFETNLRLLKKWLIAADPKEASPISEYDTYGQFLVLNRPSEFRFSKWNNASMKIDLLTYKSYEDVKMQYSRFRSISNHSYLD